MTKIAIYAGSFDPLTNGHIDVLRGSLRIADKVFIAIGIHPTKKTVFSFEERADFIYASVEQSFPLYHDRLEVISFDNLLVDTARKIGATLSIRGLRDSTDFDYEMQIFGMNDVMAPEIQTIFLPTKSSVRTITSTLVRQIAFMGGDITPFVPAAVAAAFKKKKV